MWRMYWSSMKRNLKTASRATSQSAVRFTRRLKRALIFLNFPRTVASPKSEFFPTAFIFSRPNLAIAQGRHMRNHSRALYLLVIPAPEVKAPL